MAHSLGAPYCIHKQKKIMNNKELEKKQEKQKKALNIVKWCGVGLLGGLLAFGFFGLLALGVRGCSNKQQTQQQEKGQLAKPITLEKSGLFGAYDQNNNVVVNDYQYISFWSFLGQSTEQVHNSYTYKWEYFEDFTWDNYIYYNNVYLASNRAFASAHVEGYNLDKTIEVKYIGLAQRGLVLSSSDTNSGINSANSIELFLQDMEQGYITSFEMTTYYNFTDTYILSEDVAIMSHYRIVNDTQNITAWGWFHPNQNIFTREGEAPIYNGGGDSEGLSGVFSLLYQAFSSLASILNLQVISGLTLGTFIFIPLVVGLIIFIVHLFKR